MQVEHLLSILKLPPDAKKLESNTRHPHVGLLERHRQNILDALRKADKQSRVSESLLYRLGYEVLDICEDNGFFVWHSRRPPTENILASVPDIFESLISSGHMDVDDDVEMQRKRFALAKEGADLRQNFVEPEGRSPIRLTNDTFIPLYIEELRLATLETANGYAGVYPTLGAARRVAKEMGSLSNRHKCRIPLRVDEDVATASCTPSTSLAPTEKITATKDGFLHLQNYEQAVWLGPYGSYYKANKIKNTLMCEESWAYYFERGFSKKALVPTLAPPELSERRRKEWLRGAVEPEYTT